MIHKNAWTYCVVSLAWMNVFAMSSPIAIAQDLSTRPEEKQERESSRPNPEPIVGITRLGILPISHNLEKYRSMSAERSAQLSGVPGSPYQGEALAFRMKELVLQGSQLFGRFLLVDTGHVDDAQKQDVAARQDLDGWLGVSIYFWPDHSRIEMALLSRSGQKIDILQSLDLEPDPSEVQLTEALAQIFARVGAATGHLSRISWQSGDLVTIDLGSGVLRSGERLVAGRVLPARIHPSTGEILSFDRRALYQLDVLEVNEFSSLARVSMVLESKFKENIELASPASEPQMPREDVLTGLLVWRPEEVRATPATQPREPSLQTGVADAGFAKPVPQPIPSPILANSVEDRPAAPNGVPSPQMSAVPLGESENSSPSEPVTPAEPNFEDDQSFFPQGMASFAEGFMPDLAWSAALSDPSSWVPRSYTLGAGQSYGIVDTSPCVNKPCARYSSFPKVLINLVSFDTEYKLTRSSGLSFEGRFTNYPEGDVEGYEIGARALSLHRVAQSNQNVFDFYFGPELEIGSVNTVLLKRSLLAFSVRTGVGAEGPTPFGGYQADLDLSLLDFLRGKFALDMRLGWADIPSMPAELSFFGKSRRSLKGWTQIEFGVAWSFTPSQRRMPGGGMLGLPASW